jgi:hypothetical protein
MSITWEKSLSNLWEHAYQVDRTSPATGNMNINWIELFQPLEHEDQVGITYPASGNIGIKG